VSTRSERQRAPAETEARLITSTWRRIALQTAALFALGILVLEALAVGVVLDIANHDAARQLDQAATDPDAFEFPPVDISIYEVGPDGLRASPGAAPGPVDPAGVSNPSGRDRSVSHNNREYLVRTYRDGPVTVQIALDLTRQDQERHRLYTGLAAAGGAGMIVAGGLGALIARRDIAPLGQAIGRQHRFVADASHELRTPLTQLHLRAQLLERRLRSRPDRDELADEAAQLVGAARQMNEILDELLTAAQLSVAPLRREPVDLHEVAREVVQAEGSRADQRGVGVSVAADVGPFVAAGTPAALRRVLVSLVDNALAHTPPGGRITVELSRAGDLVRTRVRDTGTGFDPAHSARIFERFHRIEHGDTRRFGLGLSLVREVVTAHGGMISAESTPGAGACFTVDLPAWPDGQENAATPVSA
jgi:signal transduction histidine kinase